jgi:uncharacterized membrane protein
VRKEAAVTEDSSREATLRRLFRIGLYLKAADSLLELAGSAMLFLVSNDVILRLARAVTRRELLEDPNDVIANFLLRSAERFSIDQKSAASFFLFSHGAVKLFLVIMVLQERAWAYPVFMVALGLLITYQCYQLSHVFSLWLAALTVLDVIVLWLTWHEYRVHRRGRSAG